jgi:hypothetical protein
MPFYFRIPLPGPFGYSHRIGGRRRRKRPSKSKTYNGVREGWRCQHAHRTPEAAELCALRHDLRELEQIGQEWLEMDTDGVSAANLDRYREQGRRILAMKEETERQIRELS